MNRNVESHFATLPSAHIQRSTFDRSFTHKTTGNVGDVIPIFLDDVLAGDTFSLKTNKLVRLQTLLAPVMDNIYLDTYFFFVPCRLVWDHWKEFMGENTSGAWAPTVEYSVPKILAPQGGFKQGSLADYFGLPVNVTWGTQQLDNAPIALPFRAYALIMNEFFRDQNLSDPLLIPTDDANQQGTNGSNYITDVANGGKPFVAAKYHDYFTSCLPAPQKGPSVTVPAQGMIPVFTSPAGFTLNNPSPVYVSSNNHFGTMELQYNTSGNVVAQDVHSDQAQLNFYNLFAGNNPAVTGDTGDPWGLGIGVNDLRLAFQTQKYYERLARGGSRYTEQILSFFGVRSPDARLQRPEYLGGNRIPLNIHEVCNMAQSEQDFLGDLGAMSVTGDSHFDFVKSFTEHGYVIGVCVARYDHTYMQGINKLWLRSNKFDYYLPVFANIGEQPVNTVEIFASQNTMTNTYSRKVFGYNEAWASYRFKPNFSTSLMRPNLSESFGHWSFTDRYQTAPVLSDSWIREDKTNVDRTLAVTSEVSDQMFIDFYFDFKATRPMPMYSIPGMIDHF